jgi:predicted kinase
MMGESEHPRTNRSLASPRPALIALGGFAGAGKTTLTRRLSAELGIPRLGSDDLIRLVRQSRPLVNRPSDAGWVAYDVLFGLAEEIIQSGLSLILDSNLGEAWRWRSLDAIRERHPEVLLIPIILRCPIETCIARMRARHAAAPDREISAGSIMAEPRHVRKWGFVETLDRPDVHFVDADRPPDVVYADVYRYLLMRIGDG